MSAEAGRDVEWNRIEKLFPDLLELPPPQRPAFLDRHCANDATLRAELESLLAAAGTDSLLDAGPLLVTGSMAGASFPDSSECTPGERIGVWRILRLIGRGGMGEVYLAQRADGGFEQRAAIKLMRPDAAQHLERFETERSIVAALDHPNIAHLLDGGLTPTGRPFMAMEYVEGENLRTYCAQRRLKLDARLQLFEQIARAVAYAHAHLVIHRDLKPGNVLVMADGQAKLLDFGVAKLLDPAGVVGDTTHAAPFTPDHAAPEQLQGLPATTAVDVYALGVLLYELLAGRPPWSFASTSVASAMERLLREEPDPPSRTAGRQPDPPVDPGVLRGDFDAIVGKCLRKTPQHRYATVEALLDDLRRWRAHEPVRARGDAFGYVARRWFLRHRVAVGAGVLVLAALIFGLGAALWQASVARQQALRAEAEAARAEAQTDQARLGAARARKVKDFLVSIFLQVDPMRRDARGALSLADAYADARKRVEEGLSTDPVLQADLLDDFGEIEAGRGDLDSAQDMFGKALARAVEAHGEDHPAVAESLVNLGVLAAYRGKILAGKEPLERAVRILEPHERTEPVGLASALSGLANVRRAEGKDEEAIALLRRALQLQRSQGPKGQDLPARLHSLAIALMDRGRIDEAEPLLREGIAIIERDQGPEAGNLPHLLGGLEDVLHAQGKLEEQTRISERRLTLLRLHYPGDHAWVASALVDLGSLESRDGRPESGEPRIREAIAMWERLKSPDAERGWRLLGVALHRRGALAEASEAFERGLEICAREKLDQSTPCLVTRVDRARLLARQGRGEEALSEAQAAGAALAAGVGTANSQYADSLEARADALQQLGRRAEALDVRLEVLRIHTALYGPEHPDTRGAEREAAAARTGVNAAP